jgi:hypothetical protein
MLLPISSRTSIRIQHSSEITDMVIITVATEEDMVVATEAADGAKEANIHSATDSHSIKVPMLGNKTLKTSVRWPVNS